jgi:integrase
MYRCADPRSDSSAAPSFERSLAACVTTREFVVTATLSLSGLRIGELAGLRWERTGGNDRQGEVVDLSWADLPAGCFHVLGKNEKARDVPIHPALLPLLFQAQNHRDSPYVVGNLSGGPLWTSGVLEILNRPMRRVGLKAPGVGGQAYRRAFNDTLRKNARGYDLERRLIMGHSIERDINASRSSTVTLAELTHVITQAYRDDPILPSIAKL